MISAACGDGGEGAPALASVDGLNTVVVTAAWVQDGKKLARDKRMHAW